MPQKNFIAVNFNFPSLRGATWSEMMSSLDEITKNVVVIDASIRKRWERRIQAITFLLEIRLHRMTQFSNSAINAKVASVENMRHGKRNFSSLVSVGQVKIKTALK